MRKGKGYKERYVPLAGTAKADLENYVLYARPHLYPQIPDGKEEINVQVNEIAYLCRQGKGTMLWAHDKRAFIFWESLDKQLDPASRTYIINHKAIKSWERQHDRRLLLEIQPKTVKPVEKRP